jgi:hypothetical protein
MKHGFVETKTRSSQWVGKNSPRPKKALQVRSNVKVMLTGFFYIEGVVHHEFLRERQTGNRWYYLEVPKRLRENVRRKRPELWRSNSWFLHHDNAPAHASLLAQADFFLYPKLKSTLQGRRFQTIQEVKENSLTELRAIPKKSYQDCFQTW